MSQTTPPPSSIQADTALYKRLLGFMWPYIHFLLLSLFGFIIFALSQVLIADLMQFLVDAFGESQKLSAGLVSGWLQSLINLEELPAEKLRIVIVMAFLAITLLRGFGQFMGQYYMTYVGRSSVHDIRCAVFNRMTLLPAKMFDQANSGKLVSRITFNVEQVQGAITNALTIAVREGATVVGLLVYLFYINWKLSLVFLAIAPVIGLVVSLVSKRFRRLSTRLQHSMGDVTHITNEMVQGNREMRIYSAQDYERQRFQEASQLNKKQSLKMAMTAALFTPLVQILVSMALCALIWFGLEPSVAATMSPGQFVSFIGAAALLAKPLRQLTSVLNLIQQGLAAAEDIFFVLDSPAETNNGKTAPGQLQGRVEFKQLSFAYETGKPILNDVSFTVEAGETVALVGSSGSGKSTIVALLMRFYDYQQGEILIDGIPLQDIELDALRQQIALVSQQVTLFNDSIYNNLAYGRLSEKARDAVEKAARLANADNFIRQQAEGYETQVGDNGVLLSGGQRQRIAIARALLKDAPILILDEATSALDNESEALIQQELETAMQGRTTFVVAHRLSTIENADKIVVLEQGRVVEAGDHATLLAQGGRYAQLHQGKMQIS